MKNQIPEWLKKNQKTIKGLGYFVMAIIVNGMVNQFFNSIDGLSVGPASVEDEDLFHDDAEINDEFEEYEE